MEKNKEKKNYKLDICPICGDVLEQDVDTLSCGAWCPTCEDVYYSTEEDDKPE